MTRLNIADAVLESCTYSEDFESGELNGWASYPLWQDTAFDPWIRPNTLVPGDPNISLEQKFPAFWNQDTYAGAQKLLDMYMVPGSTISLRYFLMTHIPADFFTIRLAAGPDHKLDYTVRHPAANRWEEVAFSFDDLVRENPHIAGRDRIRVNALAVLARISKTDPRMNYYLGLDDVVFQGARVVPFRFAEPEVFELSEWKPRIPATHYCRGDEFRLRGRWPLEAEGVEIEIASFTDRGETVLQVELEKRGDEWSLACELSWPEGLYLATLVARKDGRAIADTEFTLYVAPPDIGGHHPRLWFDRVEQESLKARLGQPEFRAAREEIASQAATTREELPLKEVVFDLDQLPDENTYEGHIYMVWSQRMDLLGRAVYYNALRYALFEDREAGEYGKEVLVRLCCFPYWLDPWFRKRGQNTYYAITQHGYLALGYDLLYELMDEGERRTVRQGIFENDILGCHRGYVEDNLVTSNTSNWVAMIAGGSLMSQAALCGDGPEAAPVEPYFTGAMLKLNEMIEKSIDPDGAYGEGGYIGVSMSAWNESLPAIERVFKVDLSQRIVGIYQEPIWSGIFTENRLFQFGDSGGAGVNAPWILSKHRDPLLGWAYHHNRGEKGFMDALYDTESAPRKDPFDENPVRAFRNVGHTVFKSGWEKDDFVFVMRTGAFYNHQHLDQGSFWLADRGRVFVAERQGSHYWYYSQDPLFLPWYIQPIGHSTILLDENPQSQRTGDPIDFAEGFDDHAFIHHFLDGTDAAFSSGDIGRLYWGQVESMRRNVLYLKPRTLLMLDTVVPGARDVDVKLLYQALLLKDIQANERVSTITKEGRALYIAHLHPEPPQVRAEEVPHYIFTLKGSRPLEREGMLTVSARTDGVPLVVANLLTTEPGVSTERGEGCVCGTTPETAFACTTRPGTLYQAGLFKTDALALTWKEGRVFAALCTFLEEDGALLISSVAPITCQLEGNRLNYCLAEASEVALRAGSRPARISVKGRYTTAFQYDDQARAVVLTLPAGEGVVVC